MFEKLHICRVELADVAILQCVSAVLCVSRVYCVVTKTTKLSRELKCGADLLRKSGTQPQTRCTERPHRSLVRSLFCAHPVAFVSHEGGVKKKDNKRFYFHIFLPPHLLIHLHSQKKRGKIQCLHAQIALVLQPARYKKQTKQQKKRKTRGKMSTGNTVHGGSLCTS